ncbi:hypothetical protein HAX54_039373, partial [Datura stramonium]|nr:hypothetical protein [Datura stramonium]
MASKGMEEVIANPSLKRLRKGTKGDSSSVAKVGHARNLEQRIDEGHLALEFPTIRIKLHEFGLGYISTEPKECKLTL